MMDYLLIWDIDGTLIKVCGAGRRAMDRTFFELYGVNEGFKDIDMAGRLDPVILEDAFMLHSLKGKDSSQFFDRYCDKLKDEMDKLEYPISLPGIPKLLEFLDSNSSFYNVLGTGNIESGARIKLSMEDMNRFFPVGGFSDRETERWQVIEKAVVNAFNCFNLEFDSSNIYVIGDTPHDIECGKKLDAKTIGVATGAFSSRQLKSCGADFVFENFIDIDAFLKVFA
jgi:phosphoglycolate phosphatase